MKVEIIDDGIIVFLNKYMTKNLDYKDSKVLESELKNIFDKLEAYYKVKIKGYYDVYIYIDSNYGAILELFKDDLDYLECDDSFIDMKIIVTNVKLLYKIDNILDFDIQSKIYIYKKDMYLEPLETINDIKQGYLLENSTIVYKNIDEIKKYGHILKNAEIMLY